jgi:hypothetical protein
MNDLVDVMETIYIQIRRLTAANMQYFSTREILRIQRQFFKPEFLQLNMKVR